MCPGSLLPGCPTGPTTPPSSSTTRWARPFSGSIDEQVNKCGSSTLQLLMKRLKVENRFVLCLFFLQDSSCSKLSWASANSFSSALGTQPFYNEYIKWWPTWEIIVFGSPLDRLIIACTLALKYEIGQTKFNSPLFGQSCVDQMHLTCVSLAKTLLSLLNR